MHQIEAVSLFPGATVLDGRTPVRLSAVHAPSREHQALLVFEPEPGEPVRTRVCEPGEHLMLTVEHKVRWTVHRRHHDSATGFECGSSACTSSISSPYAVRLQLDHPAGHQAVRRLMEEHAVITTTPITLEQLPGPGQATEPAPVGGARFYHLFKGPYVLRTGDDVREYLGNVQREHDRSHRPQWNPGAAHDPDIHRCSRCAPGHLDLTPFEVVIERTSFDITPEQLPEFSYELGPAAAHERITQAAALGAVPAAR